MKSAYTNNINLFPDSKFNQFFDEDRSLNDIKGKTFRAYVDGIEIKATIGDFDKAMDNTISKKEAQRLLNTNAGTFTQAKTYTYASEIRKLLIEFRNDEFALNKPSNEVFEAFMAKGKQLSHTFLETYTKVEFDLMQRKLAVADQFIKYWSDDDVKNLMFQTKEDSRVRASHAMLNKIVRPKKDKFWIKYTPPLEYNCRCVVLSVGDDNVTNKADLKTYTDMIDSSDVFEEVRYNAAHELKKFSEEALINYKHPYYKNYFKNYKV